jgi:EmrB/QacA subfamily drug resistance transporter
MLPMFLAVADQTIVATALPAIAASMGNVERLSWVVIAYLMASTIAAPVYGRLGDVFGRRRLLLIALAIFAAASILCATARNIEVLTLGRVLQGLGGGGLMTLAQALVGETIALRERARYQGYLAAIAVCANTFGPVAGGVLTEHFGWQSIFLVNLPFGIAAVLLAFRLPNTIPGRTDWHPDIWGLLFFTLFVVATLLALEQAQRANLQTLPLTGGLFALGAAALILLIRREMTIASPLIPVALLRQPAIWRSDALAAFHGAALVSLITFLPVYLQVVRGTSPSETGLLLVPLTIGIGTGSLFTGRMVSRTGRTTVFPSLGLVMVTLNLLLLALWAPSISIAALPWLLLWNGLFMGTVMGVVQVTVQSVSGPQRLGEAAASVQFSRSIGAAFGTAIVATVLFATLTLTDPETARLFASMVERGRGVAAAIPEARRAIVQAEIATAFRAAFVTMAAFTGIGSLLALTIPLKRI